MTRYRMITLMVIVAILLALFRPISVIEVCAEKGRPIYGVYEVEVNDLFDYSYIHSVSMTRVYERIWITPEYKLVTTQVRYLDQSGAGLPDDINDNERFYQEGGWFVIDGLTRVSDSLIIQVDVLYDNKIILDGIEVNLFFQWCDQGRGVVKICTKQKAYLVHLAEKLIFGV